MDSGPHSQPGFHLSSFQAGYLIHPLVRGYPTVSFDMPDPTPQALCVFHSADSPDELIDVFEVAFPPLCQPPDTELGVGVYAHAAVGWYYAECFVDGVQLCVVVGGTGKRATYQFIAYESSPPCWTRVAFAGTVCKYLNNHTEDYNMTSNICIVGEVEIGPIVEYDPDVHGPLNIVVKRVDIDPDIAKTVYDTGERLPGWGLAMRWTVRNPAYLELVKRAARFFHGWADDLSNEKLTQKPDGSWVFESSYACY